MSLNNDSIQRNKPILRDADSQRPRMITNESHIFNLPPPPSSSLAANHSLSNIRPSPIPGNFNIPPPPTSMIGDAMSTFNKERLHDVLQQGLGTYVFIEHYGLVPKLNHF
ncbi:unnamed protein product [Rotaria magnacalcarata]|uniref:Uncharacterized protein n=1 Tax=Rotaria magnacalcarata TaxID=392030 RepID=A0A816N127_9BILA|nr:unnamed protein product [Rotaria magnacalcarata]CAF1606048.1 unnamed protein product [Rotaria magnacalcarata]CAF2000262.1 unnamed protein product [Rotaria magnacalcarata]CAF2021596.1 unnamed protein product [Rotaria magnacalcarata]CAF2148132.1 unnamed protein product [Rotaria magnacalcarata]